MNHCASLIELILALMNSGEDKTGKTLAELGVSRAEEVSSLFAEIRTQFDAKASEDFIEIVWKEWRDLWLGRKSGLLSRITDNWLKPAAPELQRGVGASLNDLRTHVEAKIEERRLSIEKSEEERAMARERVDLSLPGVIRPIGSPH